MLIAFRHGIVGNPARAFASTCDAASPTSSTALLTA